MTKDCRKHYFVYTTDNGTAGGLPKGVGLQLVCGQKNSQYDGGHRVPMIMRWPGQC